MTGVPLVLHRSRFDPARVRAQVRGDRMLVMDRVSGRWCTLGSELEPALPLVGDADAEARFPLVAHLREQLIEAGVGVRGSEARFGPLNTLIVKVTAACNHACAYCYDYEPAFRARRIDRDVAVAAVDQALAECAGSLQVILHGGEPMLAWDLVEQIVLAGEESARELGRTIHFVGQSNLSRLDERVIRFSVEHDIVWGVSVDGPPELHDRFRTYRNGNGTYADFDAALRRFPSFVRSCGVLSTVTRANQDELLRVARYFRDLAMPSWDWTLFQPIGRGRDEAGRFEPDLDVVVAAWCALFDAVVDGEFDGFVIQPVMKYVQNFLNGPGGNMCMRPQCGAARDLASVSVDGTIEACDCIDRTGPLAGSGTVDPHDPGSLAAARSSPVAELIRSRDLTGARCDTCLWWGVCGGGCLAHAPTLNEVPDLACALALTAFDRIAEEMVVRADDGRIARYLESIGVAAA